MKKKVILFTLLTAMLVGTSNGAQFNYTWKNAEGVLNITDYPPPEDVEIIDISIIPLPDKEQAIVKKQNEAQTQSATPDRRRQVEAASLRKEAVKLRQHATNLSAEAQELMRLSKIQKRTPKLRLVARRKVIKANGLISQAESLVSKAENLEHKASQLK